jgi:hypothetical protein
MPGETPFGKPCQADADVGELRVLVWNRFG